MVWFDFSSAPASMTRSSFWDAPPSAPEAVMAALRGCKSIELQC
jgi:hypothetical protein